MSTPENENTVLDTVLGELSFFRSITRHRPVGIHRYFHVMSMQQAIKRDTGVDVPVDDIWSKLEACYDLDALEGLEIDGYDSADSDASRNHSTSSPVPGENLNGHPFFRSEFQLPWAEYDPLIAPRRQSSTSPPPVSPLLLPTKPGRPRKGRASERAPSRRGSLMVNLGGESDSSALTESENDMDVDVAGSTKPSRRGSVITGTPTETGEDEDEGMETATPARGKRGRGRPPRGASRGGRATTSSGRKSRGRR
ncbi:hypothetical protein M422DRAFT_64001 [Sphaerobolus stellatus SS14]|nr:hypothetical protein M422DRAFT_64001 [Sphaerobolus stellatus SS14]